MGCYPTVHWRGLPGGADSRPGFPPRAQAVTDGEQVEVSKLAAEADIRFPRVSYTRDFYEQFVSVPEGVEGQDETVRIWDILTMLRFAVRHSRTGAGHLAVALYVRNDNRHARLVKLIATFGVLDMDDPQPAITILLPDED